MITNSSLTIYHMSGLDLTTNLEQWTRYNYDKTWFFGGKGAGINKGYENANDFNCRIPYKKNAGLSIENFSIGDIVVPGTLLTNINTQQDLEGYQVFIINSITDNNFGNNPHIHIGGK